MSESHELQIIMDFERNRSERVRDFIGRLSDRYPDKIESIITDVLADHKKAGYENCKEMPETFNMSAMQKDDNGNWVPVLCTKM